MGLIDRQAAIDLFPNDVLEWDTLNGYIAPHVARRLIEYLPPAQPEPHWIPVSERVPEDGERVLCTHLGGLNPNRQVIEHIYQSGQFTLGWEMDMNPSSPTFMQRYMGKVVAWMPLPEPYGKEDVQDE